MVKLSVIVPVYNTEKELQRCIDSIVNQTYSNLEILLIDDASSDCSGRIVQDYARRDSRIIEIHNSMNKGESATRNIGLQKATGDVIAFCDCDDWIEEDMYENLLLEMEEHNLDLVASNWIKEFPEQSEYITNEKEVKKDVFGRDELLHYLYHRDSYKGFAYMWNKLYTRECLTKTNGEILLFDESLRLGADVLYLAEAALHVKRAKYVERSFYHYWQRNDSGCHTTDLSKMMDWLHAYEKTISLMEESKIENSLIDYIKRFMAYHSSNATEMAISQHDLKYKIRFQEIMKQYEREYISLNGDYPERIERYRILLDQ